MTEKSQSLTAFYEEIKYEEPLLILKNPKTQLYTDIKKQVNGIDFPWFYKEKATNNGPDIMYEHDEEYNNLPFFSHTVISRPEPTETFSKVASYEVEKYVNCINEILNYNGIFANCMYRINFNMTFYTSKKFYTLPHVDHNFPHNNMLIYFNEFSTMKEKQFALKEMKILDPYNPSNNS